MNIDLSVIIPCFNEEKNIGKCLDALLKQKDGTLKRKIVVVDNGSTDGSVDKIKQFNEDVELCIFPNVSISELRNYGANKTKNFWLAFVDADIEVRGGWLDAIINRISILDQQTINMATNTLFGSTYQTPSNATWIERTWYEQLKERDKAAAPRYINAGNLVISRRLFNRVGGFDIKYETGEDVKLCDDVRSIGGQILHDRALAVIHHGYPKSLGAFFRRERWHGRGMKINILTFWQSKPLLLSLYNLMCFMLFIVTFIFCDHRVFTLFIILSVITVAPLIPLAMKRGGKSLQIIRLLFLYLIYGWARTIALIDIFYERLMKYT